MTVLPPMIDFSRLHMVPPPQKMFEYVRALVADDYGHDERRTRPRFQLATAVPAILLKPDFRPTGRAFMVMARDISTTGVSVVHTHSIQDGRLAIELCGVAHERIQLALEIVRCRRLDDYYEIGARLLGKFAPGTASASSRPRALERPRGR